MTSSRVTVSPSRRLPGIPGFCCSTRDGHSMLEGGRSAVTFLRRLRRLALPVLPQVLEDCLTACRDADAVLHSLLAFPGHDVAEYYDIPAIPLLLQPAIRTRAFPSITLPSGLPLGGRLNWYSHVAVENLFWQVIRPFVNEWRLNRLGLPRLTMRGWVEKQYHRQLPMLLGFSPHVVPRPADWHANMVVTRLLAARGEALVPATRS